MYVCGCFPFQLTSYGGDLSYTLSYDVDSFDIPTTDPDVIIEVSVFSVDWCVVNCCLTLFFTLALLSQ